MFLRGGVYKYSAHRGQNLELELQVVVRYLYGCWEQTPVLCRSSKHSYLLNHLQQNSNSLLQFLKIREQSNYPQLWVKYISNSK